MYRKDLLMRQFEEFSKFLALLLRLKNEGTPSEVNDLLCEGTLKYTGLTLKEIEELDNITFIDYLTDSKKLSDEQLKMLADLLYEKGLNDLSLNRDNADNSSFIKANKLYQFINERATLPYSLDTHYKLEALKELLKGNT